MDQALKYTVFFLIISIPIQYYKYRKLAGFKDEVAAKSYLAEISSMTLFFLVVTLQPFRFVSGTWNTILFSLSAVLIFTLYYFVDRMIRKAK